MSNPTTLNLAKELIDFVMADTPNDILILSRLTKILHYLQVVPSELLRAIAFARDCEDTGKTAELLTDFLLSTPRDFCESVIRRKVRLLVEMYGLDSEAVLSLKEGHEDD